MTTLNHSDAVVSIVEDNADLRKLFTWLLESVALKVNAFSNGEDFFAQGRFDKPGCILLDIRIPGMSGLDIYERCLERSIDLPVIMMTAYADPALVIRAMKAGVYDFLEKPINEHLLIETVQQAVSYNLKYREKQQKRLTYLQRLAKLTKREREVMQRIIEGKPTKLIASEFHISVKTIDSHRLKIMEKMQASNIADLVRMGFICGLLSLY